MSGSLEMVKQAMPDEEKSGACDMVIQAVFLTVVHWE